MVAKPTTPTMEKPSTTEPTSPGGGLHDEGVPSVEEAWDAMVTLSGLARAGTEPAGVAHDPPTVDEQASPAMAKEGTFANGHHGDRRDSAGAYPATLTPPHSHSAWRRV